MRFIRIPGVSLSLAALALAAMTAIPAHADVLLQTATLGATGQDGGYSLSNDQYLGAWFQTSQAFTLTSVQIHATANVGSGNDLLFAAIVPVASLTDFPSDPLIANSNPVEFHTFTAPLLSDVVTIPFSASLPAGTFVVIFGSGEFGATGSGSAPSNSTDLGTPSYFFTSGTTYNSGGFDSVFFAVNGTQGGAAAPEPGSLALIALAGLPFVRCLKMRRRVRK